MSENRRGGDFLTHTVHYITHAVVYNYVELKKILNLLRTARLTFRHTYPCSYDTEPKYLMRMS